MNRAATASILIACMVLVVVGCSGRTTPEPLPTSTSASPAVVVLTTDQPTARISQPRQPSATAVRLNVQAVKNPGDQGLAIGVAVEDAATAARRVDIGNVSPYPSEQPGVFTLVLPGPAADLVHQEPTVLIVTVTPIQSGTVLQPGVSLSLTAGLTRL
jgi:hypothetical protein